MTVERTLLLWDTLTDLRTIAGMRVRKIQLRAPGGRKASDVDLPYRRGSIPVPGLQLAQYSFSADVRLWGSTPEDFEQNLASICTVLLGPDGDGLMLLTRRLPQAAGPGYFDQRAHGRFAQGFDFNGLNHQSGLAELEFVNLSGGWTSATDVDDPTATWVL